MRMANNENFSIVLATIGIGSAENLAHDLKSLKRAESMCDTSSSRKKPWQMFRQHTHTQQQTRVGQSTVHGVDIDAGFLGTAWK